MLGARTGGSSTALVVVAVFGGGRRVGPVGRSGGEVVHSRTRTRVREYCTNGPTRRCVHKRVVLCSSGCSSERGCHRIVWEMQLHAGVHRALLAGAARSHALAARLRLQRARR